MSDNLRVMYRSIDSILFQCYYIMYKFGERCYFRMNAGIIKHISLVGLSVVMVALCACSNQNDKPAPESQAGAILSNQISSSDDIFFNSNGTIRPGFTSHLPLVIIPVAPQAAGPLRGTNLNISLYAEESNNPFYAPSQRLNTHVTTMDSSSPAVREKPDYLLSLSQPNALLGMDRQSEWALLGSMMDPSLMRTYLAYTLADQMGMPAPQVRFCEVILADGNRKQYAGVYLLVENTGQWMPDEQSNDIVLQTSLEREGESSSVSAAEILHAPRLGSELSAHQIQEMTEFIHRAEAALYATNNIEFLKYTTFLEEDTFADYFILNEFFCNYGAVDVLTYTYSSAKQSISAGPLGLFETAIDNQQAEPVDIWNVKFEEGPWYDRLSTSSDFWESIYTRYRSLRENVLSDRNVNNTIDAAVQLLGPASTRDWARWGALYCGKYALADYEGEAEQSEAYLATIPNYLPGRDSAPRIRQAETFEQEIIRLKHTLYAHGEYLYRAYPALLYQEDLVQPSDYSAISSWLILLFVGLFFGSTLFARWRNR